MIIESVKVENFRSLLDVELTCNKLVALVGPNNVGKSSFLRALSLFYNEVAAYDGEDCYNNDIEEPISVTLTFGNLTEAERESTNTESGHLCVNKTMELPANKSHQHYFKVSQDDKEKIDFKKVTQHTEFIYIPAVHDALEDTTLKKGTPLAEILNMVVTNALERNENFVEAQKVYKRTVDSFKNQVLVKLQTELNRILSSYAPGVTAQLTCQDESLERPFPKAEVKLLEDTFATSIDRTGHGLQRAFIISLLQQLQIQQAVSARQLTPSNYTLIICIEEPEIYQHPNRQRYLYRLFKNLTEEQNNGNYNNQIIYSTHSPLFVDISSLEDVRRLYNYQPDTFKPKIIGVTHKKFADIAEAYSHVLGSRKSESGSDFQHKLLTHMTPWMNEGFFAEKVVLVEGQDDLAAVLGTAMALDERFEERGISVIPSMGKTRLSRPASVFRELGIPIYVIWDSDRNGDNPDVKANHTLLRLFNQEIVDYPHMVTEDFACFECDLYETLYAEIGRDLCDDLLQGACDAYAITRKRDVRKSPYVFSELIKEAERRGKAAGTLRQIINNVVKTAE